jgi:hypothetical protein
MQLISPATWSGIHGLVFGGLIFLAVLCLLAGWGLRPDRNTAKGVKGQFKLVSAGLGVIALSLWAAVLTGTWIVYPGYREKLAGEEFFTCKSTELPSSACSPRDFLLSNVSGETANMHQFGMEWKEHIAWTAPFLATSAFLLVAYYGPRIMTRPWLRGAVVVMLVAALGAATLAGAFGTFINKVAPIS